MITEFVETVLAAGEGIAWALFLPACFALNAAPGPNNVTAFMNGAKLPLGQALIAGLGRAPGFAILIVITAVGLGAALAASTDALWIIRILGAIYLVYIGVKMWRARDIGPIEGGPADVYGLARQDFLVAIGNPKAIAIFTAFFPQFLDPETAVAPQVLAMGGAFLLLESVAMALYAAAGRLLRGAVRSVGGFGLLNKTVAGFLVLSGLTLAANRA